jgi:hypothetical protein
MHRSLLQDEGESGMMDMPPGSQSIVQDGLDHAAQSLFSAADVPLARAEDLRSAVTSAAVRQVLEMRLEQIVKHGHTPERDAELAMRHLPANARSMIIDSMDLLEGPHRNLVVAKRRLAKAAAMLIAAIDRVSVEIAAIEARGGGE